MVEDKSTRYHRLRRRADVAGAVLVALLLTLSLTAGWSRGLVAAVTTAGEVPRPGAVVGAVTVGALAVLLGLGTWPVAVYRQALDRRYQVVQTAWLTGWREQAQTGGLMVLAAGASGALVYGLMAAVGPHWWWVTALAGSLWSLAVTQLAPVLLLPRMADIQPVQDAVLVERIRTLARRAGTPVVGLFTWATGASSRRSHALLAGLGSTRRILLSDTLLTDFSDDEIAVILAHELAHQARADVWQVMGVQALLAAAGAAVVDASLDVLAIPAGLAGPFDPAGAPLLLLLAGGWRLITTPAGHALSRAHERRADRMALDLTGDPAAFTSAVRRLSQQHLAEESPSPLVRALWHAHPPVRERLAAARAWTAAGSGRP